MATWSGLGLSGGPAAAAAAGAAAVVAGVVGILPQPDVPDPAPPAEIIAPELETAPAAQTPEDTAPIAVVEPARPPDVELETVRIDPFGNVVVAGRAAPRAQISLRVDGNEVFATQADRGGNFAAVFSLGTAEVARLLTSAQRLDAQSDWLVSSDSLLVAPILEAAAPQAPLVDLGPALVAPEIVADLDAVNTVESPVVSADAVVPNLMELPEAPSPAPSVTTALADVAETPTPNVTSAVPEVSQAPRVLRLSPQGVDVVQGGAPDAGFEIAAISYDDAGDVVVSGTGTEDGFVRLYLDNAPILISEIDADGAWKAELDDVASGVYTLRVDEVAPDGSVVSRVETPFERSEPSAVRAALSGNGGSVSAVTVQPGYTLWSIAEEALGDGALYVQVFTANRDLIRNPDLIYPGQVFALPSED